MPAAERLNGSWRSSLRMFYGGDGREDESGVWVARQPEIQCRKWPDCALGGDNSQIRQSQNLSNKLNCLVLFFSC